MNRRHFLGSAALGTVAFSVLNENLPAEENKSATFTEPKRELKIRNGFDVIVCGGGPAGVAAALAAARTGVKTQLIELQGSLGGVWTSGLLTFVFDFNKDGLTREIKQRLSEQNAIRFHNARDFVYEPEEMKWLLEDLCLEAGVSVRLHTQVTAAYKTGRRLTTIITESKSGREVWQAPVFIDTTGDGDLCAQAGCGFDYGRDSDGHGQPLTMHALAVVRDITKLKEFVLYYESDWKSYAPITKRSMGVEWAQTCKRMMEEIKRAGVEPSFGKPTIYQVHENLVLLMFNHEYKIRPDNADAITEATLRSRREIHSIVRALNKLGEPWEGIRLVTTAEQIGIREGRRIHGRYTVSKEDLSMGIRHDDAVALVEFGVDIHALDRESNNQNTIERGGITFKPYEIPMRALIPKDVDGVLMAGRCISGDFVSHASYRVTGNAVAMGEAAGIVAAQAAVNGKLPHEIEWKKNARQNHKNQIKR
jgi:hypothetical protein